MIVLASKSPRRQELIRLITDDFTVASADAYETLPRPMSPSDAVMYLSEIKARPLADGKNTVIGADTVVALEDSILGKPKDKDDAFRMLRSLSGKTHSVYTGVTIIKGEKTDTFFEKTDVEFYDLSDEEIADYISTGEPMDKAGAYGIQGYGALLVKKISGDFFNVVGLPVGKLNCELKKL